MRALVLLLLAGCGSVAVPDRYDSPILAYPISETTLERGDVMAAFTLLLRRAACGRTSEERAGFLVYDGERFGLVPWPPTHRYHAEEWHGPIPIGTVAIVHTHPLGRPEPSAEDEAESRRIGIPMIVITPSTIVVVGYAGRTRPLSIGMRDEECGVSYTDRR